MSFRFSLHGLMRLRQGIERNCEMLLIASQQRVSRLTQEIAALDRTVACERDDQIKSLNGKSTGADLRFRAACDNVLRLHRTTLCKALSQAEDERHIKAVAYRDARRGREVLDTLCEEEWQRYRTNQARREQRAADDLHLLRLRRTRDG